MLIVWSDLWEPNWLKWVHFNEKHPSIENCHRQWDAFEGLNYGHIPSVINIFELGPLFKLNVGNMHSWTTTREFTTQSNSIMELIIRFLQIHARKQFESAEQPKKTGAMLPITHHISIGLDNWIRAITILKLAIFREMRGFYGRISSGSCMLKHHCWL